MSDFKGNRYLSLRNKDDLSEEDRSRLQALLDEHEELSKAYALKGDRPCATQICYNTFR